MEPKTITVHYKGHLDDVGFEFTAEKIFKKMALKGHIEKRSDGSIELVAQGTEAQLTDLLTAIRLSPLDRYITNEQVFR
ncbi:MAG: acylphosphatase [Kiritimatiellales bacterium]